MPIKLHWSLHNIDLRVIALHPSFVNLCMPKNASLVLLISEPIRVNVFSFVIQRGNLQYPEQENGIVALNLSSEFAVRFTLCFKFVPFAFCFFSCYSQTKTQMHGRSHFVA